MTSSAIRKQRPPNTPVGEMGKVGVQELVRKSWDLEKELFWKFIGN